MPICCECSCYFPNKLFQDGKYFDLRHRKYCFSCSPFGLRKKCGPKQRSFIDLSEKCLECGINNRSKKNKVCSKCRGNKQRKKQKIKAINHKGGKCQICGYSKSLNALSFHHRNPLEKKFTISSFWGRKWEFLVEEINKCDLLCANCHQEIHDKTLNDS